MLLPTDMSEEENLGIATEKSDLENKALIWDAITFSAFALLFFLISLVLCCISPDCGQSNCTGRLSCTSSLTTIFFFALTAFFPLIKLFRFRWWIWVCDWLVKKWNPDFIQA